VHPPSLKLRLAGPPSPRFGEAGVAIDRFTGKVIDKQIEVVNE